MSASSDPERQKQNEEAMLAALHVAGQPVRTAVLAHGLKIGEDGARRAARALKERGLVLTARMHLRLTEEGVALAAALPKSDFVLPEEFRTKVKDAAKARTKGPPPASVMDVDYASKRAAELRGAGFTAEEIAPMVRLTVAEVAAIKPVRCQVAEKPRDDGDTLRRAGAQSARAPDLSGFARSGEPTVSLGM